MEKIKSKSDMLREMQAIAIDIEQRKKEAELILSVIDSLEKQYYELAEQITKN